VRGGGDVNTAPPAPPRVIVVGGGLAGMAATVALESAGCDVTLLEARKTLGGRAGSFEDPETGETLDNCQHVLLGCCTNLLDFYRRINASHLIRFERAIHFRDARGRDRLAALHQFGDAEAISGNQDLRKSVAKLRTKAPGKVKQLASRLTKKFGL